MNQHAKALEWPEDKQLKEAKTVIDKLILAAKNTAFYPSYHSISQKSVSELYQYLKTYTRHYGALVLEMGKGEILFQGQRVYQNPDLQNNPAYLCFRDGLKWISFSEGIKQAEILTFLTILNNHRMLEEESKGDIVTSLWEAGLMHVKYSTTNVLWKNEPLLDLASLKITDNRNVMPLSEPASPDEDEIISIIDRLDKGGVIQLLPEEIESTRQMVAEEEARDFDEDVLDVLLVILKEQQESEDFSRVLDIIKESFKRTIAQGEFHYAEKFLTQLHQIREDYKHSGTWAVAHLDDFLLMISGPQALSVLNDALARINADDPQKVKAMESLLCQLRPEAMISLGQMLPGIKGKTLNTSLIHVMKHHALKDMRPLIHLARQTAPAVRKTAIFVMGHIQDAQVIPIITEATRSSDSSLRKEAVKALTRQSPPLYEQLLPFIKDENKEIREIVFTWLVKHPDSQAEKMIMNYLNRAEFTIRHRLSIIMLYQALGGSLTKEAQAYLSDQLLGSPWQMGKLRNTHRFGAALALMASGSKDAENILKKASKSIWPAIRRAIRNAEANWHAKPGKPDQNRPSGG